jgi:hypothetical protein
MRILGLGLVIASLGFMGCAANAEEPGSGSGTASGGSGGSGSHTTGGNGGGWPSGGSGGGSGAVSVGGAPSGGGGGSETGNELTCDGVDDDQNGVIDDVDKGKDGVCDCLKIATLGAPGKSGAGNVFANWLATRTDFGAMALGAADLTSALLAGYEVIIAQDVSTKTFFGGTGGYSQAEVNVLNDWVNAGGGFMAIGGYENEYSIYDANVLLEPFGLTFLGQQLFAGGPSTVSSWVTPHPLTDGITLIGVDNGHAAAGAGTALGSQNGYDLLRAHTVGQGRIVMWGDEWITYDSEWLLHPEYQVELFWVNILKWLSPPDVCQVPIPAGIK